MDNALGGLEVLLVEDDFLIQLDLRMTLETAGAKVVTAGSVREGLALSGRRYHAAILDVRLGDGEVFPIAERLTAANVPVIFHSGNIETLTVRYPQAVAISKPVHEAILVETIRTHATKD